MPTADFDDVTISYETAGDPAADPVVLICGCGQPAIAWFGIVPPLVDAGYRVVTFDNRGMPPSSSPPAPYSIAELVDDTLDLLDHLGIEQARIAGHSMGGWVAEILAAQHDERVRAAAFMGSCNAATEWEKAITTVERDVARLDYAMPPLYYATETLRYLPNAELQKDEVVATWLAMLRDESPWPNPGRLGQYEACLAWSTDPNRTALWSAIAVPSLILAFEHDIDSPPEHASAAAAAISDAQYVEVASASHLGPFTHPAEVAAALVDFFGRV